jgi:formate hydrogenlyase subunit 4
MKQLAVHAVLSLFIITSPAHAQPLSKKVAIDELVEAFADAFMAKELGKLDSGSPYFGK